MAGYNPSCGKCRKCMTCRGDGTRQEAKSGQGPDGRYAHWHERVTCSTCKGRGGHPCGKHG